MPINSRETLKQYCLRDLGAPVLEINVDEDQLQDRMDEALDYWNLYHYEGIEQIYMKQLIRASELTISDAMTDDFILSEKVVGQTSGATAEVCRESIRDYFDSTKTKLLVKNITGTFQVGEWVLGQTSGTNGQLDAVLLGEYDKRYIDIPDYVYGIDKILGMGQASSSKNIFDLQYQLRLNDLYDLTSTSIIYYKTVMNHLALLDLELNGHQRFRFNRMSNKLYLDANWQTDFILGDHIIIQGYRFMDPTSHGKVYGEPWLKRYTAALFKRQWGTNLKKFSGLQLPGGVTLDGDKLYAEAIDEIKELEDDLRNKSAPLDMFIG
jgi:hypothetical protein